jgi:hypothetical protein
MRLSWRVFLCAVGRTFVVVWGVLTCIDEWQVGMRPLVAAAGTASLSWSLRLLETHHYSDIPQSKLGVVPPLELSYRVRLLCPYLSACGGSKHRGNGGSILRILLQKQKGHPPGR